LKLSTVVLCVFLAKGALAGTVWTVNNAADVDAGIGNSGDLRWVIGQAQDGDIINFAVSGPITPNSQLILGASLTFNGNGVVIDGSASGTIFSLTASADDSFSYMTLQNASTAAIAGASGQHVTINYSTISGNGYGIQGVLASVLNTTFAGNSSAIFGGSVSGQRPHTQPSPTQPSPGTGPPSIPTRWGCTIPPSAAEEPEPTPAT
jgi:hypothetical protein